MLTDSEYRQITSCRGALQSRIDNLAKDGKALTAQVKTLKTQGDAYMEEMNLYSNFLSAAIQEYEDAHPTEGE